jgi:hypothetical protein
VREARGIFVSVNLDDDLYQQEDEANSADVVVFEEFEECLSRCAIEIFPESEEQPLVACIEKFFEMLFPRATKAKVKDTYVATPR